MNPVVLRTVAQKMTPVLLLLSVVLLVRGHDAPGGGFVGGLMAASALILYLLGYDVATVRRLVRVEPVRLLGVGLLVALGSGVPAMLQGRPFLTGLWTHTPSPWGTHVELGTPLLFDVGVYLLVVGAALGFVFTLEGHSGEEV
jgi:multicomponent Na+:H+ antiporter subunit B